MLGFPGCTSQIVSDQQDEDESMADLTPVEVVERLDRFIVGQVWLSCLRFTAAPAQASLCGHACKHRLQACACSGGSLCMYMLQ